MSREQLEAFAMRLRNEMEREREERNFFQLERDKLRTFWEITRNQLDEARTTIRNKEREVEEAQERADIETKNVMQQMKHLQYENQTKIGEMRAEMMTQLKMAQEDHTLQERELLGDKREFRRQLREKEECIELEMQKLKMEHSEQMSREREKFLNEAQEMTKIHEQRLQKYMEESEIRHRMEMSEVEERKNAQISKLIKEHEHSFGEIKQYYNDITTNNLQLISTMKDQMDELRKQSERSDKKVQEIMYQNKKLSQPLKEAQTELHELKKRQEHHDRDKTSLSRMKSRYEKLQKNFDAFKWETEALKMHCEKLTEERDQLKSRFEEAALELQQKTGLRNALLERKLEVLQKETEQREAILGEVLTLAGMEPQTLSLRIEKLLAQKNEKIEDLRYEVARMSKAYDDLLATFESKMIQHGIPIEEIRFQVAGPGRSGKPTPGTLVPKFR
ncbi:dynein regulatory complex subunit 4 [Culicoides brevitarsis]|uniref:dynein regulatory complex subunit 4 n=1 Tax=Culicoides brevitarsis TaxID=469753 RepID=UPI00307B7BE7